MINIRALSRFYRGNNMRDNKKKKLYKESKTKNYKKILRNNKKKKLYKENRMKNYKKSSRNNKKSSRNNKKKKR